MWLFFSFLANKIQLKKIFRKNIYIWGYFKTRATGVSSFFHWQNFKNTDLDGRLSTSHAQQTCTYVTLMYVLLFHEYYSNFKRTTHLINYNKRSSLMWKHYLYNTHYNLIEFSYQWKFPMKIINRWIDSMSINDEREFSHNLFDKNCPINRISKNEIHYKMNLD